VNVTTAEAAPGGFHASPKIRLLLLAIVICAISIGLAQAFAWTVRWPEEWFIPLRAWISSFFTWLGNDAHFGLFSFRDVTRGISWLLSWPLHWTEVVLYRGVPDWEMPPLPWIAIVAGAGILGTWLRDLKLGVFAAGCTAYLAVFGLWTDAMRTLSIVLVSVPVAAGIGLALGIASTRSKRAEAFLTVCFDLMQATPHMAYLTPIVVLFGFGQVPAMLATVIFAMPPMARCTILGIRGVSPEIIEAARMSGCNRRQLLWKAEIPAAQQTLLLGLNQVVMQTLAMAVIASLVGASGLGQKLLFSLQQLRIGAAVEQGLAIVLIAIVLDRLTQAAAYRPPDRWAIAAPWTTRHRYSLMFIVALIVSVVLATLWSGFYTLPKELTISFSSTMDTWVRWISKNFYPYIQPVRDWITVTLLLKLRDFYLILPWTLVLGLLGLLSWHLGRWRLVLLNVALAATIMLTGFWKPAMMTIYLVTASVIICVFIGVPLGIWCSRSERVARVMMSICDTLQTFPSFIYLIPVVMLLKVGDLSNIIAILAYASVPAIRFTYLGLRQIAPVTLEAAKTSGCTKRQMLWKVQLPIAMPEIMLGINQVIMMALAMTAITALIGSRDLGQEIYKALPGADTGRGLLAGLSIAFIGIIADRLINAWARQRKQQLGIE